MSYIFIYFCFLCICVIYFDFLFIREYTNTQLMFYIIVTDFGTRNLKFDLQTWLGGAITNLATCNDELVGTNMSTILKDKIIMSLEKVTTLVNDQWAYVQQMSDDTVDHDFQSWFDSHDWKLMQADAISANITVASDGSGDFTSIMEAVKAAPNNSLARFVIYIKKATYKEYVSIPQNKWNIMMVGDGMDQTIISGSHSNTTGYGTYGSATFGNLKYQHVFHFQ